MSRIIGPLLALILAGCGSGSKPTVWVGHVAPLRGADQSAGRGSTQGIRLALQELHADQQQKLQQPVAVLHANASGDQAFRAEAIRLKQINQVSALLGGIDTQEALALDQSGLPVVSGGGWRSPDLSRMVFLTGLTPSGKGEALAELALRVPGPLSPQMVLDVIARPVGLGGASTWFSLIRLPVHGPPLPVTILIDTRRQEFLVVAEAFVKHFDKKLHDKYSSTNLPGATKVTYDNDVQFAEHVKHLSEQKPALVFLAGEVSAVRTVLTSPAGKKVTLLFAGPEGSQAELLSSVPSNAPIFMATAWVRDADTTQNREFVAAYTREFGEAPDVYAALAHDNVRVLVQAVQACSGNVTPTQIRDKLAELKDFPMLTGSSSFNETGQLSRPAFLIQIHHGNITLVDRVEPK
jgi:ABC-type branched-subunit amino acid transport system substrate-binding protein